MRLNILGPGYPFRGGIARTTTELVQALSGLGHDVRFFSTKRQYPRWLFPGKSDVDTMACSELPQARRVLDPLNLVTWFHVRQQILSTPADAWILPYWAWVWAPWWRFVLRTRPRPPVVTVVHNPADHDAGVVQRMASRLVLKKADGFFTHAESLARALKGSFPGLPVVSHPLPPTPLPHAPEKEVARSRIGLGKGDKVALFLGLIRPYKGIDVLVDAFARLPRRSGWTLLIAGEPWHGIADELRKAAGRAELEGRIQLELEWVSEDRMATLLAAADVVVLPYRRATQSAILPQALAAGVPVICSTAGGLSEVVENGVNGITVEPGSVSELERAILSLDSETRAFLAEGASSSASLLTWDSYARAMDGLLHRICTEKR
ncbi:MAG: glycosyltransferase family 4 protein [bacterium]|nr:glycosyltransferase family 4 protein [bacterium]